MKKKVLLAAVMVLWLMVFSTVLSFRIEEIMTPRVTTAEPRNEANSLRRSLPLSCLLLNEQGFPYLFEIYDGVGWESGSRAAEARPDAFIITEADIEISSGIKFVSGATKSLAAGEQVRIIKADEKQDDLWLAVPKESSVLRGDMPESISVLASTNDAILLNARDVPAPFMENIARSKIFESTGSSMLFEHVFSQNDILGFLKGLRLSAASFGCLAFALILWAYTSALSRNTKRNKRVIAVNGGLFILSLAAAGALLHFAALSGSLLPAKSIVDFPHYMAEYAEITAALKALPSPEAAELLTSIHTHLRSCLITFATLPATSVFIIINEHFAHRGKPLKHRK